MNKTYYLETESKTENLKKISDFIFKIAKEHNIQKEKSDEIIISTDEAATNIILHAYQKEHNKKIRIEVIVDAEKITISLFDTGISVNIDEIQAPKLSKDLESRQIGGLGIYLMNKFMDKVEFHLKNGNNENEVRMIKFLQREEINGQNH